MAIRMHDNSSSVDPLVSQSLDRLEAIQCTTFSRARPFGSRRGHLKAIHQVEGHDAQSLPCAVERPLPISFANPAVAKFLCHLFRDDTLTVTLHTVETAS